MDTKQVIFVVLFYITVVGALNWGLQVAGYNLVENIASLAGNNAKMVENSVYVVVALAGLAAGVMYTMYLLQNKDDQKNN